jgi:site-specific DNA-methyltransferase (adenine-specific)
MIKLIHGDCLVEMQKIPDKSIDAIICDLPYGTTACKWDTIIPFEPLWAQYKRIIKDNGAIVLFGSQPFTSALVMSNPKWFKQSLVWNKIQSTDFVLANKRILKQHEDIILFWNKQPTYNPIMVKKEKPLDNRNWNSDKTKTDHKNFSSKTVTKYVREYGYPKSILTYNSTDGDCNGSRRKHPTQKPVPLLEYLIKTYTNEGDTVLDNTMGSGSCGCAAKNLNRNFIGIEMDDKYFEIAKKRIESVIVETKLDLCQ